MTLARHSRHWCSTQILTHTTLVYFGFACLPPAPKALGNTALHPLVRRSGAVSLAEGREQLAVKLAICALVSKPLLTPLGLWLAIWRLERFGCEYGLSTSRL